MSEFSSDNRIEDLEHEESSSSSKRSRTSAVWDQFDAIVDIDGTPKAKCKICGIKYVNRPSSGTFNMKRHLEKCLTQKDRKEKGCPLDREVYRKLMAEAFIMHGYPFSFVEHEKTRNVLNFLNAEAPLISRNTLKLDVIKVYNKEKENLKGSLASLCGRICLTTDLWSSITTDEYMVITAHYVDEQWKLQKKILSFTNVPPPRTGVLLAEKLLRILKEWKVEKKVFSLTLDNASYNDVLVNTLKIHLGFENPLPQNGELFHIRCVAHILNLIVQDGLKVIEGAVDKIRESVKYVKGSEARKVRFAECLSQLSFLSNKKVRQDVPTRWNSTYLMLDTALAFRRAFVVLSGIDPNYKTCPSDDEWDKAERISRFLKPFYEITTLFSGIRYPTANLYFHGVWRTQLRLLEEVNRPHSKVDDIITNMAKKTKSKFDKYWDCYSLVLSFAVILDPRYKLHIVEKCCIFI